MNGSRSGRKWGFEGAAGEHGEGSRKDGPWDELYIREDILFLPFQDAVGRGRFRKEHSSRGVGPGAVHPER